jgi:hypothetical protein
VAGDDGREVVLIMGVQGSGKTDSVASWVARGYERLNRDDRGGSLRGLVDALDARLAAGARRLVLDNTYVTRAQRRDVLSVAARHGAPVRGLWLDTPIPQAQVNLVMRMLAAFGRLLDVDELKRVREPNMFPPGALFRAVRELELPAIDEGFAALEIVPFTRRTPAGRERGARFVALDAVEIDRDAALGAAGADRPRLGFGWRPGAGGVEIAALRAAAGLDDLEVCVHPGGPPRCWCRPPLPGLPLALAARHGVDPARSTVAGTSPAHRALAAALGAAWEPLGGSDPGREPPAQRGAPGAS